MIGEVRDHQMQIYVFVPFQQICKIPALVNILERDNLLYIYINTGSQIEKSTPAAPLCKPCLRFYGTQKRIKSLLPVYRYLNVKVNLFFLYDHRVKLQMHRHCTGQKTMMRH